MEFKTQSAKNDFIRAPAALKFLMECFDHLAAALNREAIVTRILDRVEGESGVHQDYRAADFRNEYEGKQIFSDEEADDICRKLNAVFPRKDGKLIIIHHSFQNHAEPTSSTSPKHFHMQIPWEWKQDPLAWVPRLRGQWEAREDII